MHWRKGFLLSGSLTLLLLGGTLCGAALERAQAITKEAVLHWVDDNREAQPAFQAGDVLSLADLEKLPPFLPPGYLEEFRFPEVSFAITRPGDYSPPQLFRTATEQYAGQTRLAADGALENYVAEQPFASASLDPQDPSAGLKAIWNYNFRRQYYGQKTTDWYLLLLRQGGTAPSHNSLPPDLLAGGGTLEQMLTLNSHMAYLNHLAMRPDTAYALPGAEQFEWKLSVEFTSPCAGPADQLPTLRGAAP